MCDLLCEKYVMFAAGKLSKKNAAVIDQGNNNGNYLTNNSSLK